MKHAITTIINYCTNDIDFITQNVRQAAKFSQQIIVPYCDHFYNGDPENFSIINKAIQENPEADFIKFPYDHKATKNLWRGWTFLLRRLGHHQVYGPLYWCCYNNLIGFKSLTNNPDYVLILDTDEIIDADKFIPWLNANEYQKFNALKLANYWYWRSPKNQATTYEAISLLVKYSVLKKTEFMTHAERHGMFQSIPQPKKDNVMGLDQKPMIHHYGWAKPKQNLLKKVKTWGHTKDRNWTKLIETEFSHPFSGTDFIYKRRYQTVKPFVNII